jgi:hypothetical protein
MAVMEGADIGAIFSMLLAAYVVWEALVNRLGNSTVARSALRGLLRVVLIAAMAGFVAVQFVDAVITTYKIKGGSSLDTEQKTPAEKWNWATQWSQPKVETLALVAPGLFGYRLDSPKGGNYWGSVGADPAWEQWYAGDKSGQPPMGVQRFIGSSPYGGVLVLLLGAWSVAQALRREKSAFDPAERKLILFWGVVAFAALLFAWGRFAPFYQILYALPYFSSIRNPVKFMFVLNFALTILFAYGLLGLWRRHVSVPDTFAGSLGVRFKRWRASLAGGERNWFLGSVIALALAAVATLVYTASRSGLERHLAEVGFSGSLGKSIASFSIKEAWLGLIYLAAAIGLLTLTLSGWFAGVRSSRFAWAIGVFVLLDLGRAAQPYIVHWDYTHKYDLTFKNPVIELLKQKPYEQRVSGLPFPVPEQLELLGQVYRIEWAQHQFLYHNIQSLDIVQMPRMPADLEAFERAWSSRGPQGLLRRWELTNTRYLLGPAGFVEGLNDQLDKAQKRFSVKLPFTLRSKAGVVQANKLEDLTAVENPAGPYAVIEFAGALPRAKLFSQWTVNTNDTAVLDQLFSADFDPHRSVIVAQGDVKPGTGTNTTPGTVTYTSYAPKRITLDVNATEPALLLLNDRYEANWKVTVDGQPASLLRCNFIMRGVQVPAGKHTVEFAFRPAIGALYITLVAMAVTAVLLLVVVITRLKPAATDRDETKS